MTCPHGEVHPSACMPCLDGPPPERPAPPKPTAERWMLARHPGRCAATPAHIIEPGEPIGVIDGEWMCERCTR